MKHFLACVAFLAASAWSAIGLQWTKLNFDNGSLNIDTTKTVDVDTSYINIMPNQGFAYYSSNSVYQCSARFIQLTGSLSL